MGFFYLIGLKEKIKLINGTKRYFISNLGYCYKESKSGFKKTMIGLNIIQGIPRVRIENEKLNLVLLLIEHFYEGDIKENIKYSWKVKKGRVPFDSIKVITKTFDTHDEALMFQYKCRSRASSANNRVSHSEKITPEDVLNILKRNNLHCSYCNDRLKTRSWHLDHVTPISKGGLNTPTNLTASCKRCNLMKGSLQLSEFLDKCKKITENYK